MFTKALIPLLSCVLALAACQKKALTNAPSPDAPEKAGPAINACELITGAEIQAVQASPIKDSHPSGRRDNNIQISQCYFSAEQSNRSVSLTVTASDTTKEGRERLKESWDQMFHRAEEEKEPSKIDKEKRESLREQSGEKEEGKGPPPKKIEGIGEEAYWVGSRVGGALYVLKKNAMVRISLGGPDEEPARIDKSKTLAQKAIDRL